jgi:hypothetical protein
VTEKRRFTMNSTAESASVDEAGSDEWLLQVRLDFLMGKFEEGIQKRECCPA